MKDYIQNKINKRVRYSFLLCIFLFFASNMFGQEDPVANQYYFNYYLENPAVAGSTDCTYFMFTNSMNWVGIENAPMTQLFSFQTRLKSNIGIGAYLFNDRNGYTRQQGGQFTLAYHIILDKGRQYLKQVRKDRQLSFGVSAKFFNFGYDPDFDPNDPFDPAYQILESDQAFNANVGVYYTSYGFFTGLSAYNLATMEKSVYDKNLEPIIPLSIHALIGNEFSLNEREALEPSLLYRINANDEMSMDLNLRYSQEFRANSNNSWWIQGTYRQTIDKENKHPLALIPMVGFQFDKWHIAYAYEVNLNSWAKYSTGTHQIMLGYTLCQVAKFCR